MRLPWLFFGLVALTSAQYSRHRPPIVEEEEPPPPEPYRPLPQQNAVLFRPASVHYVNIGAELAGDYKFGYDTGKGNDGQSFREETRLPDGTVRGAYGYVDGSGRQRIVKYTAGKDGYKAEGDIGPEAMAAPIRRPAPRPQPQPQVYAPEPQNFAPQQSPPQPRPQAYAPEPRVRTFASQPRPQAYATPQPRPQTRAPSQSYAPQAYAPQTRPQAYAPQLRPQAYAPQPRPRPRPRPRPQPIEPEPDYDRPSSQRAYNRYDEDPDNDIYEKRVVPIDTSLFNYNIGTKSE